jgi:cobalt-zinc-cadmium efflux system outer membrane protein
MNWRPATSILASLALAGLLAGCQDRHSLTGQDGLFSFLTPPRQKFILEQEGVSIVTQPSQPASGKAKEPPDASSSIQLAAASERTEAKQPAAGQERTELGLNEAIETGLSRNPDLVALKAAEGVNEALVDVAGTYPFNPTVQTRVLPYAKQFGHNLPVNNYVLLWQQFELAHQRRFREQNAAAILNAVRWNIHQAELQNVAMTSQLYFAALYQRGLRELAELTAKLNDELLDVMAKREKSGTAKAAEVAVVRIDTKTSRQQAALADVNYRNALLALRRQLNLPPDAPLELKGDLTAFDWHAVAGPELGQLLGKESEITATLDRNGLVNELAARRPDVLAARANTDAGQANLRLARAARVPNLFFGPFYGRDSEAIVNVGFQAQMDIPVVNTGRPLVRQRQAELRQQLTTREQLEAKARMETRTALDRYDQALSMYKLARTESAQQVPTELNKLEEQFKKGEIDFLRIFQARNSLLQYRKTHLDSLNELALAAAALTAAAGLPPAALISQPRPEAEPPPPPEQTHSSAAVLLTPLTKAP